MATDPLSEEKNKNLVLSFGQVGMVKWHQTDGQTESDAYEPSVHKHDFVGITPLAGVVLKTAR